MLTLLSTLEAQKESPSCSSKEFQCDDGTCIHALRQCNGCMDCSEGEDEILDTDGNLCQNYGYTCHSDSKSLDLDLNTPKCIHWSSYCDGSIDCVFKDDELFCKPGDLSNLRDVYLKYICFCQSCA